MTNIANPPLLGMPPALRVGSPQKIGKEDFEHFVFIDIFKEHPDSMPTAASPPAKPDQQRGMEPPSSSPPPRESPEAPSSPRIAEPSLTGVVKPPLIASEPDSETGTAPSEPAPEQSLLPPPQPMEQHDAETPPVASAGPVAVLSDTARLATSPVETTAREASSPRRQPPIVDVLPTRASPPAIGAPEAGPLPELPAKGQKAPPRSLLRSTLPLAPDMSDQQTRARSASRSDQGLTLPHTHTDQVVTPTPEPAKHAARDAPANPAAASDVSRHETPPLPPASIIVTTRAQVAAPDLPPSKGPLPLPAEEGPISPPHIPSTSPSQPLTETPIRSPGGQAVPRPMAPSERTGPAGLPEMTLIVTHPDTRHGVPATQTPDLPLPAIRQASSPIPHRESPALGPDIVLPEALVSRAAGGGSPAPGASSPSATTTTTVTAIPERVAEAALTGKPGMIELALSPQELGTLRLQLQPDGDTIRVIIFAERPDTMELLRRHTEQFAQDLRHMGFGDASFSFTDQGPAKEEQSHHPGQNQAGEVTLTTLAPTPATPDQSRPGGPGGLDLRL